MYSSLTDHDTVIFQLFTGSKILDKVFKKLWVYM